MEPVAMGSEGSEGGSPITRLQILLAAVLWGTTGTAQTFAPHDATPLTIGAARLLIGGTVLLTLAAVRAGLGKPGSWRAGTTLVAAASMAGYQVFFFNGVALTGVAVGTMVSIGSSPIIAGALALWLRGERPSRRWYGSTILGILGVGLLLSTGGAQQIDALGIMLALLAGLSYGLFAVASKDLLEAHPPEAVVGVVFFLGAVLLTPVFLIMDTGWLFTLQGALIGLHLGLIATALAYVLFSRGLRDTPVASAVTLTLAEPLTASLLGLGLLGERVAGRGIPGLFLLVAGLVWLSIPPSDDPPEEEIEVQD